MSENIIKAVKRETQGTGASRRLRRTGKIPAIVYGEGRDPLSVCIEQNPMFYALQKESFHTSLLKLDIDGEVVDVIVRDFQMHPYKQAVQHMDFQIVNKEKPIRVKVPLHLRGGEVSPAVKLQGCRIVQLANTVELLVLPEAIPAFLELDLSKINSGEIRHLSEITLPEGAVSVALKRGMNPAVASASGK